MNFFLKKLGCPKNDVDGDYIIGRLIESGHTLSNAANCDAVIVNSCGFILPAKEESINEILQYDALKKSGKIKRLYITGCLSQRYGKELREEIPGIDGIFGLGRIDELINAIDNNLTNVFSAADDVRRELTYIGGFNRFIDNKYPYEYLKIADGCDRFCNYCAIPYIRGKYRSRPMKEIIAEANKIAAHGKKEIILVSQEGTGYGKDFNDGTSIIDLMKELEKVEGIEWIRLMYLHPESVTEKLIEYLTASSRALGYFDIPLQHISDKILKSMNRRITRKEIENILEKIRQASPENIIRTTFIAGFPGETKKEYEELRNFITDFEFDRLGVFKYSPEDGTPAVMLKDPVSDKVAEARVDELMLAQQGIAFEKNIALIGSIQKVIIDQINDTGLFEGRTAGDCPEIDQMVSIKSNRLQVGDIKDVRITGADGYDLFAETIGGKQ